MTGNLIRISEDLSGYGVQPFEGPLDLLLYLIQQEEVDIYDIPIAQITGQYLAYLEAMKELDLEIAGEFILMAAMLIRIKSRMLMPRLDEPETEIEDPRSELVAALTEYRKFKQAADELGYRGQLWERRYERGAQPEIEAFGSSKELHRVDIGALMLAFAEVLERTKREESHEIVRDEVTIADQIKRIAQLLTGQESVEFGRLFEEGTQRMVVVVTFMALLELARLNQISLKQAGLFGKIWVYPINLDVDEAIRLYAETK